MIKNRIKGLVSVIIPCYNGEKFIADAIESVIDQTYQDIELIVVDDYSTDNSLKVISEFDIKAMKRLKNFIVILKTKNEGSAISRNKAIEASSGEFLAFLDCDDYYEPDKIRQQVIIMNHDEKVGLVHTSYLIHDIIKNAITAYAYEYNKKSLLQDNYICLSTTMVRANVLDKIGLFDPKTGGSCDWDMWVRIESEGYDIDFIKEPLLTYQIHDKNTALVRKNRIKYELEKKLIIIKKAYIRRGKPFKIKLMIWRTKIEYVIAHLPFIEHPKIRGVLGKIYRIINKIHR